MPYFWNTNVQIYFFRFSFQATGINSYLIMLDVHFSPYQFALIENIHQHCCNITERSCLNYFLYWNFYEKNLFAVFCELMSEIIRKSTFQSKFQCRTYYFSTGCRKIPAKLFLVYFFLNPCKSNCFLQPTEILS